MTKRTPKIDPADLIVDIIVAKIQLAAGVPAPTHHFDEETAGYLKHFASLNHTDQQLDRLHAVFSSNTPTLISNS